MRNGNRMLFCPGALSPPVNTAERRRQSLSPDARLVNQKFSDFCDSIRYRDL